MADDRFSFLNDPGMPLGFLHRTLFNYTLSVLGTGFLRDRLDREGRTLLWEERSHKVSVVMGSV